MAFFYVALANYHFVSINATKLAIKVAINENEDKKREGKRKGFVDTVRAL
jgi:hypothetical protein